MSHVRLIFLGFCLLTPLSVAGQGVAAQANDELFDMSLEQLLNIDVSVASRKEESWLAAAGTVYVFDRHTIAQFGWRDMKEILAAIPNMDIFYQWSWLPGGQRGFTGNMASTLLLIDGREVQNLLANEAFIMNNFPAHRIERVEVLMGPNSTLYGGNAAQGVINIITRLNSEQPVSEIGGLVGEVGTRQAHFLSTGMHQQLQYGISGSWFTSDLNYRNLREFVFDDSRFSRNPTLDKIRDHDLNRFRNEEQNFTLDLRLNYRQLYAGADITRTENVSGIERVAVDFATGDDSRRGYSLWFVGRHFEPADNWQGFVEFSQFREYKEKLRQKFSGQSSANNYDDLEVYTEREDIGPSYRYRLRSQFSYQQTADRDWIFGYDGWRTDIGSKVAYVATDTGIELKVPASWPIDKEQSDKHAVYAQLAQRWQLAAGAQFNVTAGLRYNRQDFTDSAWLPRVSAVYLPDANSAWKLTYGEAFRPPTIFEFDGVSDGSLASQTMDMWELNYSRGWRWHDLQFSNALAVYSMQVANFYQKIFDVDTGTWRTEVQGEQQVNGIENLLRWQGEHWQGFVGARYVEPDKTAVNGQSAVLDIPRTKLKLGISYQLAEHWHAAVFVEHFANTKTEANSLDGSNVIIETIPAWTAVNFHLLSENWAVGASHKASFGLYIENLFNRRYYHSNPRGSSPFQFIQPPRNARVQFTLSF